MALIPDIEALLGDYLRGHPGVAALQARVSVQTPSNFKTRPWVKLTLLDAPDRSAGTDWLIEPMVQLDCYASETGGTAEANLLARTVREALRTVPQDGLAGATTSQARVFGMLRRPDGDFEPARERYILTATIPVHRGHAGS